VQVMGTTGLRSSEQKSKKRGVRSQIFSTACQIISVCFLFPSPVLPFEPEGPELEG